MTALRPVHLNLFVGHGYHEASWRVAEPAGGPLGLDHAVAIARLADSGPGSWPRPATT